MTHVISATYTRFDRMSPTAAALAVALHVATALALWWVSPLNHRSADIEDQAIDVTVEQPKPAPPAPEGKPEAKPEAKLPPSPSQAKPPPPKSTPAPQGLPPPSPTTAETSKQIKPKPESGTLPLAQPHQPEEQQQALAPSPEPSPPPAPLERSLPPLEAPPPPLTSKDFPAPPPPPRPAHPQAHAPPPAPKPQLRPSPLPTTPPPRSHGDSQATAPTTTFVNPADQYSQSRLVEQYLWSVASKISKYRYQSNQVNEQGTVVLRLVISRDGRLVDASVAKSSGFTSLDRGLIQAARAAAPYAPLPNGLPGSQIAFTLPFASIYRPR
ncbi:MAG: TonB family protein [Proteobacteria bacterium]|nr:TonB family protein [Pseudomonadota bacterium]